ncbi:MULTISPECIES: hypothetical protein [unclassified Robiginitalea]|uniref:hypothetical protein n=1 Tax=Robiginitalea TaxID=252306 RepID=UPI00234A63AB|nr:MULTISPECIES: hypothetical protein [unclassified Robiginitalea]MDC6354037.1 hypothetical protein [Robiginitalea sp. PM2]MDC6374304.1 hypothetical protein [Robiginitalea sp. SP8]
MKKLLAGICLFLAFYGHGQEYVDVLNLSYGISPETGYEAGPGETRIDHADLNLFMPIPLSEKTALITGALGTLNRLKPYPGSESMALYNLGGLLGLNIEHLNYWSTLHLLIPRQSSSFQYGRTKFQLGTLQLVQKKLATHKNFSFGFYMNTEEYGIMFVPIGGYYYRHPDDLWEFSALLPSRGDINLRIVPRLRAGLTFDGLGSSFPIENADFGKAYVQRISNDLSAYLQYRLTPSLIFAVRSGYSLNRSYRIYAADDKVAISIANIFIRDPRTVLNESIRGGFLFNFRFTYRFHLTPEN